MLRTLKLKVLADTRQNKLLPPHHFYAKFSYFSRHFMQTVKVKMPKNNKYTNFDNILHLYKYKWSSHVTYMYIAIGLRPSSCDIHCPSYVNTNTHTDIFNLRKSSFLFPYMFEKN